MSYLKITNTGEIDINALTLLGASSKAGDNSKIGFFGSGNKYALATFLRNGVEVKIFSGAQEFVVATESISFRGQPFERITINAVATSLTTRTGPEWELWMALREFLCNAIDEGGHDWRVVEGVEPASPGETSIYLSLTSALMSDYDNIEDIVITDVEPIEVVKTSYGSASIYNRRSGKVYRKGICCSLYQEPSLFAYSFDDIPINESRVAIGDYLVQERITSALAACTDRVVVDRIVSGMVNDRERPLLERRLLDGEYWSDSYCGAKLSEAWRDSFLARASVVCPDAYTSFMPPEDVATYLVIPMGFYEKLIEDWPEIPHVGDGNTEWVEGEASEELKVIVDAALKEVVALGLNGGKEFTVRYVNFVDDATIMMAPRERESEILVSARWREGVNYAAGLLEEFTHRVTGHGDGSRALQTFLFAQWLAAERRAFKADHFKALIASALEVSK